jgi:hypothetical protein
MKKYRCIKSYDNKDIGTIYNEIDKPYWFKNHSSIKHFINHSIRYGKVYFEEFNTQEVSHYGLSIRMKIPVNILNAWAEKGNKRYSTTDKWSSTACFMGDREIISFTKLPDGIVGFQVSGTSSDVYLRAEGFKEFFDTYNKPVDFMENPKPDYKYQDLTGRYIKALVDNADGVYQIKVGEYAKIINNERNPTLDWTYMGYVFNRDSIGTKWELMPEGFDPKSVWSPEVQEKIHERIKEVKSWVPKVGDWIIFSNTGGNITTYGNKEQLKINHPYQIKRITGNFGEKGDCNAYFDNGVSARLSTVDKYQDGVYEKYFRQAFLYEIFTATEGKQGKPIIFATPGEGDYGLNKLSISNKFPLASELKKWYEVGFNPFESNKIYPITFEDCHFNLGKGYKTDSKVKVDSEVQNIKIKQSSPVLLSNTEREVKINVKNNLTIKL